MDDKQKFTTILAAALLGGIIVTSSIASKMLNPTDPNRINDNATITQGEVRPSDLFYVEDMINEGQLNDGKFNYMNTGNGFGSYSDTSPGEKQNTIEAIVRKQEVYLENIYRMLPSIDVMLEMYYNSAKEYQIKNGKNVTEIGEWIIPTTSNIVHDTGVNEKIKSRIALEKDFNVTEIKNMKLNSYDLGKIWIRNSLSQSGSSIENALKTADFTLAIDLMTNPDAHLLNYMDSVLREKKRLCTAMLDLRDNIGVKYGIVVFGNIDQTEFQTTIQDIDYEYSNFLKIKETYYSQFVYTLNSDVMNTLQTVQQQMASHSEWYVKAFKSKSNEDLLSIRTQYDLVPADQRVRTLPTPLVPPLDSQLPLLSSDPQQRQLVSLAYNLLNIDVNKYPLHFTDVQFSEDFLSQGDLCQQWEIEQKQLVDDINRNLNALKTYIDTNSVPHYFSFLDVTFEPIKLSW